ncbi:MAG: response regulator [Alphaproteobacteria bacterium]|nr:response regulator [Alphaproteobacteria bacterium]MCB9698022.1 response regulator [Alphaproteobacteria bacterium]
MLVVDDDPLVRATLGRVLARHCEVELLTPEEAHERVARGGYDVLLTDLEMGRFHGETLAADSFVRWPDARIVVMTGSVSHPKLSWPVIKKPLVLQELLSALMLRRSD